MKSKIISLNKDRAHFTGQAWMVSKLGLVGDELIIYSIIYGFSQDGKSVFAGSSRYLSFWTGKSRETVLKNLKSLRKRQLIDRIKKPTSLNNSNRYYCDYWATITRFPPDIQEIVLNNWSKKSTTLYPQDIE